MPENADPLDAELFADASGRCERRWLEVACHAIERLETFLGHPIELGPYWINENRHAATLHARLRARSAFPFVGSDCWEGHLTIGSAPPDGLTWVDVLAFPFRQGRAVTDAGRYWYLSLRSATGLGSSKWLSGGWHFSDGPGEWEWVTQAGTVFDVFRFPARSRTSAIRGGGTVLVELDVLAGRYELGSGLGLPDPNRIACADVSFYSIERDGVAVHGPLVRPPGLPGAEGARWRVYGKDVEAPILHAPNLHPIESGWTPGAYEVVYRVQGLRQEEGNVCSHLSEPVRFRVEPP